MSTLAFAQSVKPMLWQLTLYEIPSLGVVSPVAVLGNFVDVMRCYDANLVLIQTLRQYQLAETYFSMCVRVL